MPSYYQKKTSPWEIGDESFVLGDELLYLRDQNLRGEGAILGIAAEIPIQALYNTVNPNQAEASPFSLGGAEAAANFRELLSGGEVGKGDVELGILHVHVDPDQALLLRKLQAGFHGVVKEIAQDAAQIQL